MISTLHTLYSTSLLSLQILMSVKQERMSVMTMQHAVTQRGVMSVPATQDMVAMEYLAQVYNIILHAILIVLCSKSVCLMRSFYNW